MTSLLNDIKKEGNIRMRTPVLLATKYNNNNDHDLNNLSKLDDLVRDEHENKPENQGNVLFLMILLCLSIVALLTLFFNTPKLSSDEIKYVQIPRSADDLRALSTVLLKYRDQYYWTVVINFCALYMFLQAFAIPGAIFLSILAGPLFGVYTGLFIVSCVATSGAAVCYGMSNYLGRGLVQRCLPVLLNTFRAKIKAQRHNLFFYLLFLRISPLLPNWFISVSAPILNVPLPQFVAATFLGLIPANYLHVNTGMTLSNLQSVGGIDIKSIITLFGIAFLALIPTLFRKKFEEYDKKLSSKIDDVEMSNHHIHTQ